MESRPLTDETNALEAELEVLLDHPYSKTTLLRNLSLRNLRFAKETIRELQTELGKMLFHPRKDMRQRIKAAYRIILSNLVACVYERRALAISGTAASYSKGTYLHRRFLTQRSVNTVLKALENAELLTKVKGNPLKQEVNKYIPTPRLERLLIPLLYCVEESYEEGQGLIRINRSVEGNIETYYANTIAIEGEKTLILPEDHPDIVRLRKVNSVLKQANYALKTPIYRVYSNNDPLQGGRLYCALQQLPDRKARIRINTLFDGIPCVEVDLSCNHAAMLMALSNKQLQPDFYSYVGSKANCSREKVKFMITRMIGANNRSIDLREESAKKEDIPVSSIPSVCDREQIEYVLETEFPEIYQGCYRGLGVFMQNLEGEILLDAMSKLVDQGILSLPVHDSLFVQHFYREEAKDALETAWSKVLGINFKPWVKIDYSHYLDKLS